MFESIKSILDTLKNPPDPNWHVEKKAKPTKSHPLGGFWKRKPHHNFGLAIGAAGDEVYYISFCGPGGCFDKGTYRPNSSILNDPDYKILDMDNIEIRMKKGFKKYTRSKGQSDA